MKNETAIVLTDDWELRGNGTGDVETLQVRPATRVMDIYDEFGVKSTFHAEVMQQLAFCAWADRFPRFGRERDLWVGAVQSMLRRGFDVQLHIHPQWFKAEFDGRWWKLGRKWNLADYSHAEIDDIVGGAVEYLSAIVRPARIVAFRAGAWGIGPPSRGIFNALVRNGIRLDVSMNQGLHYDGEAIRLDYTQLQCPYTPYFPDMDDFRRPSDTDNGLIEIPTQSIPRRPALSAVLKLQVTPRRLIEKAAGALHRSGGVAEERPPHVMENAFGAWREDRTLDLSAGYAAGGFHLLADACIRRAMADRDRALRVLVFTNHTKDLRKEYHFSRVRSTIRYIRKRYPAIRFMTMSEVYARADELVPAAAAAVAPHAV